MARRPRLARGGGRWWLAPWALKAGPLIGVLASATTAWGQMPPDREAFLKSISESVDGAANPLVSLILLGIGGAVLAVGIAVAARQDKAPATPSANQPAKLRRSLARAFELSGHDLRQLTILAEELAGGRMLTVEEPLGLLLCPSKLLDAAERGQTRADPAVLRLLAERFAAR